jgi:hypothetical protein
MHAVLSPLSPGFTGRWSIIGGADAALFAINENTGLLSVGPADVPLRAFAITVAATQSGLGSSPFSASLTLNGTQQIVSITPTAISFTAGAGSANTAIGTEVATLNPASPAFAGTWNCSSPCGVGSGSFRINASTGALTVGPADVAAGTYQFNVIATQSGVTGSPLTQQVTLTGSQGPQLSDIRIVPNPAQVTDDTASTVNIATVTPIENDGSSNAGVTNRIIGCLQAGVIINPCPFSLSGTTGTVNALTSRQLTAADDTATCNTSTGTGCWQVTIQSSQ